MEEHLQTVARFEAGRLTSPDKKQLRFNEIVTCATQFYPGSEIAGIRELVEACDKVSPAYVSKRPMWQVLRDNYGWMLR